MAITLTSIPPKLVAAHNQVLYTIQSSNTAQPNFNFVIDVKVIGVTDPIARLQYPVQPSSSSITIDIGPVLKNLVSYDFIEAALLGAGSVYDANQNSRVKYYCEFRELYDVAGTPTLSVVLASDPTSPTTANFKLAANAIMDFEDFSASGYINRDITQTANLLNYVDDSIAYSVRPGDYLGLTYLDRNVLINAITVNQYDSSDGFITQNLVTGSPTANEYIATMVPFNITGFVLQDNTAYVEVLFRHDVDLYAIKRIYIDRECSKYQTYRIHWWNKWGAFESYNFRMLSRHTESIQRKQFKSILPLNYAKSDRLKTNYNTYIDDQLLLNSDLIFEDEDALDTWFETLMTSPVLFYEKSRSQFIAYNIVNAEYEFKKYINDKRMYNITISIAPSYTRYRQSL